MDLFIFSSKGSFMPFNADSPPNIITAPPNFDSKTVAFKESKAMEKSVLFIRFVKSNLLSSFENSDWKNLSRFSFVKNCPIIKAWIEVLNCSNLFSTTPLP